MSVLHRNSRVLFLRRLSTVRTGLALAVSLVILVVTALRSVDVASAATNTHLNFQARLQTNTGAIVPDGYYNVQFKLYDVSSGGTALWTESHIDTNGVTAGNDFRVRVKNGYLTVSLGSQTSFPTTINWDQDLWITMNIGGMTQTATPTYDGEMSPRLKLTGVPYAFRAGQLATYNSTSGFTSVLELLQPTVGNQIFRIQDQAAAGTYNLCIQNSTACGFAPASGSANYIQNTTTPQTGNFYIVSAAASEQAGVLVGHASQTAPIFEVLQNIGATDPLMTISSTGATQFQPATDSTSAFNIRTSSGNNIFTVDTTNSRVGIGLGSNITPSLANEGLEIRGALRLSDTITDTFVTPLGANLDTKINIPLYNPGNFNQIIALGLPSTASDTSRAITVFDARTSTTKQPALALISPNESEIGGFSWDSGSRFLIKSSTNEIALNVNAINGLNVKNNSGAANVGIGNTASNGYALDVTGDINTSTQYRIGGNVQMTASALTFTAAATGSVSAASGQALTLSGPAGVIIQSSAGDVTATTNSSSASFIFRSIINGAVALSVQNSANASVLGVNTTNGQVYLGQTNTLTGVLQFARSDSGNVVTLSTNALTAPRNISLPDAAGTICLDSGNCGTTNGKLQDAYNYSTGSTTPEIKLDGTRSDLDIQDSDAGLSTSNNFISLRGSNASGLGSVRFGVGIRGDLYMRPSTDLTTIVDLQNASGNRVFTVDTANGTGRIGVGLGSSTLPSYTVDAGGDVNTATIYRIGGLSTLTNSSLSFTAAGASTIQSAATQTLTVDSGTTGALNLGTGANAKTITLGNVTGATSLTLNSGTGNINLRSAASTIVRPTADSASAFIIQDSSGITEFQIDTAVGQYSFGANGIISGARLGIRTTGTLDVLRLLDQSSNTIFTVEDDGRTIIKPSANSTTAFQIQPAASATPVFNVDTTNGRVGIGTATPNHELHIVHTADAEIMLEADTDDTAEGDNPSIFLSQDGGNNTARLGITGSVGSIFTNSLDNAAFFGATSNEALQFITNNAARITVLNSGNVGLGTNNPGAALQVSGATAATDLLRITDGTTTAQDVLTVADEGAVTFRNRTNSTTALLIQNAGGTAYFTADSTNSRIIVGTTSNGITLDAANGVVYNGTTRLAKKIQLLAEYPGSVLDAGTMSNNLGTMTSGIDLTNRMNYYKWTTSEATNQSYDVVVQVPVPADFSAWASNPVSVTANTSNTTNGTITIEARDSSGTVETGCNFVSVTPGSTSTWATNNSSCALAGTYTAGGYMTLRVRLQSPTSGNVRAGNIILNYLSNR